jgi:CRP-like cAMP-binding protein
MSTPYYSVTPFYKGEIIFKEGQQAKTAYLIKSGVVTIQKKIENTQVTIAHINAGHIFGEMGIISGEPRNATALAEDYCELVVIDHEVLSKTLSESPMIIQAITKALIERLRSTSQQITPHSA